VYVLEDRWFSPFRVNGVKTICEDKLKTTDDRVSDL
jgi:hypothetical protein